MIGSLQISQFRFLDPVSDAGIQNHLEFCSIGSLGMIKHQAMGICKHLKPAVPSFSRNSITGVVRITRNPSKGFRFAAFPGGIFDW